MDYTAGTSSDPPASAAPSDGDEVDLCPAGTNAGVTAVLLGPSDGDAALTDGTDATEVDALERMLVKAGIRCDSDHPDVRFFLELHRASDDGGHSSHQDLLQWLIRDLFARVEMRDYSQDPTVLTALLSGMNIFEPGTLPHVVDCATGMYVHDDVASTVNNWVLSAGQGGPRQAMFPYGEGSGSLAFELCGAEPGLWAFHFPSQPTRTDWANRGEVVRLHLKRTGTTASGLMDVDDVPPSRVWYHGTSHASAGSIIRDGIQLDVARASSRPDFGNGFYLANSIEAAIARAQKKYASHPLDPVAVAVLVYRATRIGAGPPDGGTQYSFEDAVDSPSYAEWQQFVFEHLTGVYSGECRRRIRRFDRILGPVSNGVHSVMSAASVAKLASSGGTRQCVLTTQLECDAWSVERVAVVFFGVQVGT